MVDKKENTSINESIIYARKELFIAFRFCVYMLTTTSFTMIATHENILSNHHFKQKWEKTESVKWNGKLQMWKHR